MQTTVPVEPATGKLQLATGPEFWVNDTSVVPAGSGSVSDTPVATSGPAFVAVMTYVMFDPAVTLAGPVLVT